MASNLQLQPQPPSLVEHSPVFLFLSFFSSLNKSSQLSLNYYDVFRLRDQDHELRENRTDFISNANTILWGGRKG
jgi:uncharacterized protein YigA (DUF484 family)